MAATTGAPAATHAATPPPIIQQSNAGPQLDSAQKAKADARRAKMQADLQALNTSPLTPAQKQAKFLKLKTAYEADMLAILTPSQRKVFLAARAKAQADDAKKRAIFQTRMIESQKIGKQINDSMTADQKKQLLTIKNDTGAQAKKIYDDKTSAPEAKKAQMDALEKGYEGKVMAIMTPAQQKLFQKLQVIQAEQIKLANGAR
ncbi:hypothetical protein CCAX7_49120 [Capsulimonas corticalis]|uniref:Uncharacterized protein n=2 Tax=Capsulimonas corticalis TaxID=2219043 RepID=A0A402CQ08_9BACT|nr:hypothetical protein CCAX7_49120 [Capsulimonas corticalis]